jgi:hypothetical protein
MAATTVPFLCTAMAVALPVRPSAFPRTKLASPNERSARPRGVKRSSVNSLVSTFLRRRRERRVDPAVDVQADDGEAPEAEFADLDNLAVTLPVTPPDE